MLKYAKIINEETKQCDVGTGTNAEFYKSIGMTEMDVEQAYDGGWYIKGFAPEKPESEIKAERIIELERLLASKDYIGVKIATGCATIEDYAEEIAQCEEWRKEIRELKK